MKFAKKLTKLMTVCALSLTAAACASTDTTTDDITDKTVEETGVKDQIVTVTGGQIQGSLDSETNVASYKGIPYAAAPVGDLRWKDPQDVEAWDGVKECTEFGASSIQTPQSAFWMWSDEFIIDTSKGYDEDCLTLNVWSKDDDTTGKPVLVFIHGGGLSSGGSSCEVYDGSYMAEQDVVVVSINYRVGTLGFLTLPELDEESESGTSGNYGFKDQIKALQWVQDNIAQFGGDASNVTIMGQSAGGMSVNVLMTSPEAEGLFNKAISMSSLLASGYSTMEEQEESVKSQLDELDMSDYTLEELRSMSAQEIFDLGLSTTAVVDDYIIKENYSEALADQTGSSIDMILGYVDRDGNMLATQYDSADAVKELYTSLVGEENLDELLELYPIDEDKDFTDQVDDFYVDIMAYRSDAVSKIRNANGDKTYTYEFSYIMPGPDAAQWKAFHTSDVPYAFHVLSDLRSDYWTEDDTVIADMMSSYFINFIKTGDPNGDGLTQWDASTTNDILNINVEPEVAVLSADKLAFFEKVFG